MIIQSLIYKYYVTQILLATSNIDATIQDFKVFSVLVQVLTIKALK